MRHTALQLSSQICARHVFSQRHGATEIKHTLAAAANTALRFPPCLCASGRKTDKHLRETTPTELLAPIPLMGIPHGDSPQNFARGMVSHRGTEAQR